MPPDDNILPNAQPPQGGTSEGTPAAGNGADTQGDGPVTLAAAAELITQAISPMADRLEELGRTNSALAAQLQSTGGPAGGAAAQNTSVETRDFLTDFSENPEGAIDARIGQQLGTVAPLVSGLIDSTVGNFVRAESQKIDGEFGAGAWEKFIEKPLGVIVDSYRQSNVTALASNTTITREVDGLKGRQFDDLVAFREASRQKTADAAETGQKELVDGVTAKVVQQTNLTGGIRRIAGAEEEITEDLKGYLAERSAAIGKVEDPKDFLGRTDYGNTYEDFQAHQKKLAAAEGGK